MERRTFLRRVGLAGVSAALAGCSAVPTPLRSADTYSDRTLLGVYPGATSVRPFERWAGRRHPVVTLYVGANRSRRSIDRFAAERLTAVWDGGHVPMITWEPYLGGSGEAPNDIERRIADGDYDRFVERWVAALSRWLNEGADRRAYFRPLPEMNGGWLPWSAPSGGASAFVEAWRRLRDAFVDAGIGSEMQWVWNPNAAETSGARTEAYYPGDEYVDWLGVDGYNFGDSQAWSQWQSPAEVFEPMLSRIRSLADKPVALPEFGTTSMKNGAHRPAAKAAWIDDVFRYIADREIGMACWFNVDKETDWAVFGGNRGTDTAQIGGRTYETYSDYRRAIAGDRFAVNADAGGVISDAAFAGRL